MNFALPWPSDLQVEHLKEVNQVDVNQYILYQKGLREILQTILIHVVKDAKPLEYFHTLFHHHALPSVTTPLYHDSDFGDSKLIWCSDFEPSHTLFHHHALPWPVTTLLIWRHLFDHYLLPQSKVSHFLEAARGQQFAALGRHNVKIWLSPFITEITVSEWCNSASPTVNCNFTADNSYPRS